MFLIQCVDYVVYDNSYYYNHIVMINLYMKFSRDIVMRQSNSVSDIVDPRRVFNFIRF